MEEPQGYSIHPLPHHLTEGTPEEKAALAQDIRAQGLLAPVTRHGKWIVDGRRRLDACELAGVEPRFEDLPADADPVRQSVARNFLCRHMSPSQRASFTALLSQLSTPGRPPDRKINRYRTPGPSGAGQPGCRHSPPAPGRSGPRPAAPVVRLRRPRPQGQRSDGRGGRRDPGATDAVASQPSRPGVYRRVGPSFPRRTGPGGAAPSTEVSQTQIRFQRLIVRRRSPGCVAALLTHGQAIYLSSGRL